MDTVREAAKAGNVSRFRVHSDQRERKRGRGLTGDERKMRNYVGGSIDFVQRQNHRHKARMPRLSWWQQIIDDLGESRVVVRKVIPPLEDTVMKWVKPAVMPTLALVSEIIDAGRHDGAGVIVEMMRQAKRKIANKRQGARDLGLDVARVLGTSRSNVAGN